jgi:hypothetical protein
MGFEHAINANCTCQHCRRSTVLANQHDAAGQHRMHSTARSSANCDRSLRFLQRSESFGPILSCMIGLLVYVGLYHGLLRSRHRHGKTDVKKI